ncbi:L,D-transpeptidase family protein [Caldimonas sp. KR1-144]|uniref:L,D-transpeptidase family protein n=1 Tax=Caldimonas sp. KR1-144 TaxID=3400911 RepID=UPI003BFC8A91
MRAATLCALWLTCLCAWSAARAEPGAWLDAAQRPNAEARDALSLLAEAASDGLDPADYRVAAGEGAAFDAELTRQMLRYLRHLHAGRVDARALGFRIDARGQDIDFAERLAQALRTHRLRETAADLAPDLPQYRSLRALLARYRLLAAQLDNQHDAGLPAGPSVREGDSYAAAAALRRRLRALGDLDDTQADEGAPVYDTALSEAVTRFQARHGLAPDGVLGRATQAALRMPLAARVRQIELAMERLRWLPPLTGQRFVAINIPMFRLWAVEPGTPSLSMGVVVGRALRTPTPVLLRQMREVVFRPYWNVPRSIVRKELLPAIARDARYLEREAMEIVRGAGDDANAVEPTPENLALLADGALRLRQRPGPRNALGRVKFVFPNDDDVYMHDTPATALFERTRRDFSHGCVRVQDPAELAHWVLRDAPEAWPRERIDAAMASSRTERVALARPIPVLLFYVTAVAMPDGTLHFADDIYGHDARLTRALSAPH